MASCSSSSTSFCSCRMLPVALEITFTSASSPRSSLRGRRPRRVLYPASRSRRPLLREAPDQALRWLQLLSALVLLQIYMEETHTCAELQSQSSDTAAPQPQEGDGSLGPERGRMGEEPWRVHSVDGASESQLECMVS